ncbi:hypothetical protein [Thermomonas sp.]|uniref:hypothetical protein n=1 Tax=Thermomonas sp. TaxID=1971895 RepID=UPI0026204D64|nr:hypothetical protein [Thermomonas sp.]MBL0227571.1 hypothetical protein [Thermomonas sp.]
MQKLTRDDTPGVRESPIIDGATGRIYTFVYNDNTSFTRTPVAATRSQAKPTAVAP